jgi:hypothetical protein
MWRIIREHVGTEAVAEIDKAERAFGRPQGRGGPSVAMVRLICKALPEHSALLINGLFSAELRLRSLCADRIRFVPKCRTQVLFLLEGLAQVEKDKTIASTLKASCRALSGHKR